MKDENLNMKMSILFDFFRGIQKATDHYLSFTSIALLMCFLAIPMNGMDVPLPDPMVLGKPLVLQNNGRKKVDDPAYEKAQAARIIQGGGYSYSSELVSRAEWAYSLDQYNYKILSKQIQKTFKVKKVFEGTVDENKIVTWYDEGKGIWIRLYYSTDESKRVFGIRVELADRSWVGPGLNKKYLEQYPLPAD